MNTQTVPPSASLNPVLPPMGYPIGTILHGNNPLIGNLWIITMDNSYEGALLFDGRILSIIMYIDHKRDKMSPGMRLAAPTDVYKKLGGIGKMPQWAEALILMTHKPYQSVLPKPSTAIPPQVLQQINKSFATITPPKQLAELGLLAKRKSYGGFQSINAKNDEYTHRLCPSRKDNYCSYQPYYGFTDNFEYCQFCDHKRNVRK